MSINFLEAVFVKLFDYSQADIFKRNDAPIGRPVNERMIPLVFHTIDCCRVVRIGPGNDHAGQSHNIEL